jgi:hypothetical protein
MGRVAKVLVYLSKMLLRKVCRDVGGLLYQVAGACLRSSIPKMV